MAVAMEGGISLWSVGHLRGDGGLAKRNVRERLAKFSNGELMGKKLNQLCMGMIEAQPKTPKSYVCMSLTADVAGEVKVSHLSLSSPSSSIRFLYLNGVHTSPQGTG